MRSKRNSATHIALLSPAVGTPNVGDHFIEMAIRRLLQDSVVYHRFTIRQPLTAHDIDVINTTTCAVLCGTNLYQHDWHSALTPEIIERIRVPVIPFGVGSSAHRLADIRVSETTGQMIRALHAHCTAGSVRDPHSLEVVYAAGVSNTLLTGCPVLFWACSKVLPSVRCIKRRRLVLTARNWLMHRWPENVDHPVQIQFLLKILESFPTNQLMFVVHEDWDERLVDHLRIPSGIVFRGECPEDYQRLYTDDENVILALRLHAGMLAVANGVPALFVGHDTRTYSFCQMLGLEYVELFGRLSAEDCVERLQRILDGEVAFFRKIQPQYKKLCSSLETFLRVNGLPIRKLFNGDGLGLEGNSRKMNH
jgi:hypothetical protein